MISIYGSPRSSAGRVYWMLEELGLSYKQVPLDMSKKEHKSPEYCKLNPNGKVPCLQDGDLTIWESMAVNTYLAAKYKKEFMGNSPEEIGLIQQWSYWAILDLQRPAIEWFIQNVFIPTEKRDPAIIEKAKASLPPLFKILDDALKSKTYLVGNRFTMADLNVASVVNIVGPLGFSYEPYKNVQKWLSACKDRPAYQKYAELRK